MLFDAWSFPKVGSRQTSAADGMEREPNKASVFALLCLFAAIWALYFWITEAPVAIKHDMAEAYAWGQEFQLGYNQHPPFWAWICGLWFTVLPRTGWAFALLSSVNATIGIWGAWILIGDFARGRERMAATALLLVTPLYTFYGYKYNANIIFLSVWPWTTHYFMKSLRTRRIVDAIAFGAMAGLAIMSKYYAVILIATCLLAALQDTARRQYFVSRSPYVSASVAAVICAPHVGWLLTHNAPPLRYLDAISGQGWGRVSDLVGKTLVGALEMNLGVLLIVGVMVVSSRRERKTDHEPVAGRRDVGEIATLALAPLLMTIASGLALRIPTQPEMTIGTFALLPLLIIRVAGIRDMHRLCWISTRLAGTVTIGALVLSPAVMLVRVHLDAETVGPYQEVAIEATKIWRDRTPLPLAFVGGSDWYENAIVFYGPERPHAFVHFDYSRNLWVTPEGLAKHGLLSVCVSDDRVCLAHTAEFVTPETTRTEVSLAHVFWGHVARPVQFVITVVPPRT